MASGAVLVLEDGAVFEGLSLGIEDEAFGEVVFNTSLTGYQEILTDPSYAGQIVVMTYPQIGNYGVCDRDNESRKVFASGFAVREASRTYSSWRADGSIQGYLRDQGVVGIADVDTRAIVRHIRSEGAMRGVVSPAADNVGSLVERVRESPSLAGRDLVKSVTCGESYQWNGKQAGGTAGGGKRFKVIAYDFGVKRNILAELERVGCEVTVVPASTDAASVLSADPDGVFLSNGPGDPAALGHIVDNVRHILGRIPMFGICLGHQIIALALGGATYKLKFGHRGGNQPVRSVETGKVEITVQNHGFAVTGESLSSARDGQRSSIEITHTNLNDGTIEGLRCPDEKVFSVQYHPEASPGPHDAKYLFAEFAEQMRQTRATG